MKPPKVSYRDVTGDPEAAAQANRAPELRAALLAEGFAPVGLVEVYSPDLAARTMSLPTTPDLEVINDVARNGEVDEVFTSPDQHAFAAVESAFDKPVVCIRTLMEDGCVVETTMRPTRPPRLPGPFDGLPGANSDQAALPMSLALKLMQFGAARMPLWPRGDWPRAGYHVELVDTRDVGKLWRRHKQRLEAIQRSSPAAIRPHLQLPLYMCFNCRTMEIMRHQASWGGCISNGIFALFVLAISLTLLLTYRMPTIFVNISKASPFSAFFFLVPVLLMLVVAVTVMILMGLSNTYLAPRLPGPRLRAVPELLAEVQTRLTTDPRPRVQTPPPAETQIPSALNAGQPRPAIVRWFDRYGMLLNMLFVGAFAGMLLSESRAWTLVPLSLPGVDRQLGLGLVIGTMSTLAMASGISIKRRAITGSIAGLVTASILPFIPLEYPTRFYVSMAIGVLVWVAVGWLVRSRNI